MNKSVVLALDIGGTNIRIALVTEDGIVIDRSQSICRISEGRTAFLTAISSSIDEIRRSAITSGCCIVALGAGVPGLINLSGEIISSVNLKPLDGFDLRTWLESSTGLPSTILNDANAAAVAEQNYGAGRPYRSFLHFTLGTGVGSGLVLDGKLWTGRDGVASEYGHTTVEPEGHRCQCGNHGCLEQYASATAISRIVKEKIGAGAKSLLSGRPIDTLDASDVASAASAGDPLAVECFRVAGRYLGIAIASAVNLLNLEAVIIGGGVAASFDLIEPAIRKELELRAFSLPASRVRVIKGELGDNAGIIGAAASGWKLAAG
ncbi:MAG TPA: ROK family protein [Geobacteraceae bacterium]|nr:ROK family protein [Geobacteraceae bacterium]